ncbi:DUF3299 domain-containing protein [Microbulbifer thermotolerans]|uniref:Lipoprotein n=1 Tax=Microbulbifer thermotolerans TaxID=252514 RepID=A0A143HP72_MICTH|nr:DUF3299 domain-containing protein [Microbulbifer thermotolerans]AMX03297.1 hypothetical protein A3224_12550 [Microbulbifer thermotolerans]
MPALPLKLTCLLLAAVLVTACKQEKEASATISAPAEKKAMAPEQAQADTVYRDVQWEELIPKDDLDALLNPPAYLDTIVEGSAEDQLPQEPISSEDQATESRYQKALTSTRIKPEFDRQKIRIPGFVVPLEFDETQTIFRFLLVPYFGACLHLPPPPPNQVIYASFPKGMRVDVLYDPFYVEGELRTLRKDSDLGTAAYSMQVERVYPYEE